VHFVPGFPVMAWPMIEWVLDTHYKDLFLDAAWMEKSVIIFGSMEAMLTPLMEQMEKEFEGIKVFSLPSVDHLPEEARYVCRSGDLQNGGLFGKIRITRRIRDLIVCRKRFDSLICRLRVCNDVIGLRPDSIYCSCERVDTQCRHPPDNRLESPLVL
jgi:hypothetical protein